MRLVSWAFSVIVICLLSACKGDPTDAFIGNWTSYDGEIRISKQDKIYQIDFLDNTGQMLQMYEANKVGDILFYRDNNGNGKQIKIYVPVNPKESKEGKIVLDYKDSLNIRLITNDGDYFIKFQSNNQSGGYVGTWRTEARQYARSYEAIKIDSTPQEIRVSWIGDPDQIWKTPARFQNGLLNITEPGFDGGIYVSYFQDGDYITIGDDKYYRYDENDDRFLGYWKNSDGEIKISKNGDYYLVRTYQFEDYTFDFMTEVKDNTLQEPLDEYAIGKTYHTITYLSPGVILGNDGAKYYNISRYSKDHDYTYPVTNDSNSSSVTEATKSFSGSVGNLQATYNLTWRSDGTIYGTYFYPDRPNITYTLKGKNIGNGRIQLTEYTGNTITANCNLSLKENCYIGQMINTDGRALKMSMCQ